MAQLAPLRSEMAPRLFLASHSRVALEWVFISPLDFSLLQRTGRQLGSGITLLAQKFIAHGKLAGRLVMQRGLLILVLPVLPLACSRSRMARLDSESLALTQNAPPLLIPLFSLMQLRLLFWILPLQTENSSAARSPTRSLQQTPQTIRRSPGSSGSLGF